MAINSARIFCGLAAAGLCLLLLLPGCGKTLPADPPGVPADAASRLPERETWEVLRIQGARVGYGRTTLRHADLQGRDAVKIEVLIHVDLQRFGQKTEQEIRYTSTETPGNRLLDFQLEMQQGVSPARTVGRVVGDRLELETTTQGKKTTSSVAWSPEWGGLFAVEASLLRRPMQPGERRTVRALSIDNQAHDTELTARKGERVELMAGAFDLLRIEAVTHMGRGQKIEEILWTDRAGEILKRRSEAMMNMETVRATKELALAKTGAASFDLGRDVLVKLDRPLAQAHDTRLARYRVRLEGGDPAKTFPSSPAQQVKPIDAHTAEITVRAVRPGMRQGGPVGPADPPTDADRQPNNFIQSDDAKVVADAREAAAGETDPWRVAVAVERYVERVMTKKDFTQAFATAAEVARNREGDCTEHAVYLAALARARGIPARVAMGLVYLPRARAFGYHMWTEVYVGGQWIGMDGTLGKGGIGAGHLRLAHSSLEGNSAYSSFLPIVQVAGRLRIELLEAE